MHHFTLRQLEYLSICIEQQSIAKAARILNVSQPTISAAIMKLEESLGVQLLIRLPSQGVMAAETTTKILRAARSLLADATALENAATQISTQISGELRLGCFSTFAPLILPRMIGQFGQQYPDVTFALSEGTQRELIEKLSTNQLDMAFLYDVELDDQFSVIPLATRPPYVVLHQGHALCAEEQISLEQLVPHPMILLNVPPSQKFFLNLFRREGLTPKIAYSSPSLELVRSMVGNGLGYSILVTRPHGDLTYDGQPLEVRPLEHTTQESTIALVRPATIRHTRLMNCFAEAVKQGDFLNPTAQLTDG